MCAERFDCMENSDEKTIRVLHGPMNIANQMEALSRGLNENGVYCRTVSLVNDYLRYPAKYPLENVWERNIAPAEVLRFLEENCVPNFDMFNFHFGRSFTRNYSDLHLLSSKKKPIVMHHWGSDARSLESALKINPYAKVKPGAEKKIIDTYLRYIARYIKHCIVQDEEMKFHVTDYYEHVHIVPVMIDMSEYEYVPVSEREKMLIVHAPTHTGIKGTETIVKVMSDLQQEFDFDFKLIKGYSHAEAKKLYAQADLVIDQLHLGIYGMVSIEAMAMGKPVICYVSDFMLDHYPKDLPVMNANPDTFPTVMKSVLKNKDVLPELGKKARTFVEARHDMLKNSLEVKRIYQEIMSLV